MAHIIIRFFSMQSAIYYLLTLKLNQKNVGMLLVVPLRAKSGGHLCVILCQVILIIAQSVKSYCLYFILIKWLLSFGVLKESKL